MEKKVAVIEEKQRASYAALNPEAAKAEPAAKETEEALPASVKEQISIDEFDKMELRIGEVIACEAVEKSKKLLCSQVRIGSEVRQILSGIRKYYTPEEMVGKKVVVITNLKPAKLAGLESNGMILCAEDAEGRLSVLTSEADKDIASGATIN